MQKWAKGIGRESNYYCPENLTSDILGWRLLLRDILNELVSLNAVNSFEDKTYSAWYKSAKTEVVDCLYSHTKTFFGNPIFNTTDIAMRTPSGTASTQIQMLDLAGKEETIRVDTIHSKKGSTFDAVLLVSTPDARGTGYWEKWVDDKDETTRFAYVASTRPKHLLCWAVPKLNCEQINKIESIGLRRYNVKQ